MNTILDHIALGTRRTALMATTLMSNHTLPRPIPYALSITPHETKAFTIAPRDMGREDASRQKIPIAAKKFRRRTEALPKAKATATTAPCTQLTAITLRFPLMGLSLKT